MDEYAALRGWTSVVGAARPVPMATVTNPLWRVVAEDGREWVLKHLPEYPPGAGPVDEYRVLSHLQATGLPVPVPVITDAGQIAHNADHLGTGPVEKVPTGAHAYVLIPLLPGDSALSESPEQAYAIGAGIGRLTRALGECPWPVTSYVDDPAREILAERHRLPEELRAVAESLGDRLYAAIVDLPTQRTHGDLNLGNVLVHDGAVSGYLDFDHLPTGLRIRDLSYYLASRFGAHVDRGDPEAMAAVLGGYVAGFHEACPVTERELAAIVPLMITVAIGGAAWRLHGWNPDPAGYRQELRVIDWLTRRYDELAAAASGRPV